MKITSLFVSAFLICLTTGYAEADNIELVDNLDAMTKHWMLEHHMGVGKGLYPGTLKKCREMGITPFYGGTASPIVADGLLFCTYYKPNGHVPARVEPWRTMDDPASLLPEWFFSVTADDICIAIDAKTGDIKWQAVEKNRGFNRLAHKRSHWCITPAYSEGIIFSMGSGGMMYAYNAEKGKKLWETLAMPNIARMRDQHLASKKLCWTAQEGAGIAVADSVVIVSSSTIRGFDIKDGEQLWHIDQRIQSRYATPSIWQHKDRKYILAHTETGDLRLVDPKNGLILWHKEGLGNELGTLTVAGDTVITNLGSKDGDGKYKYGIYGALSLSLKGADVIWSLPDNKTYQHWWKMDSGARGAVAVKDNRAYIVLRLVDKADGKKSLLVVVNTKTGKILSQQDPDNANSPQIMEDKLLLYHDRAHSDPVTASWWTTDDKPRRLNPVADIPHATITAYEVPIQWPYKDGLLFSRGLKGLICYNLRKPQKQLNAGQVRFNIPGLLTGKSGNLDITLYQQGGKLTHGGFKNSGSLHAVDVSEVKCNDGKISGTLKIDIDSNRRYESYDIDLEVSGNGNVSGRVSTGVKAFKDPLEIFGDILAVQHEPHWMPKCTHVLRLENASFQNDRSCHYTLLFLEISNDRIIQVAGFAPRTTKGTPVIDSRQLKLNNGRLTGTLYIRYRPDPWTLPLVENDTCAAAEYKINCNLKKTGTIGSYKGKYGVEWISQEQVHGKLI